MAWTVTKTPTVFGNKKVVLIKLAPDSATFTVETGLSYVEGIAWGPGSMTSATPKVYPNSNTSGIASAGVLGCSGFTSGDELYVTVFGR